MSASTPTFDRISAAWLSRGFWATADQALLAGSNFALNLLLARWMTPAHYGAFALAYSIFLFAASIHSALIIEPMLVFGSGRYQGQGRQYLGVALRAHWTFSALLGGGLVVTAAVIAMMRTHQDPWLLVALAAASPAILYQWLVRRMFYLKLDPMESVWSGLFYLGVMLAGALALNRAGWLSPALAVALMGIASLASAAWMTYRLRLPLVPARPKDGSAVVLRAHWDYGRWSIASGLLSWVPNNLYYFLLPLRGGLEAVAALRAVVNFTMPVLHTFVAVSTILVPAFVRARDARSLKKFVLPVLGCLLALSTAYYLFLLVFRHQLLQWTYGGRYAEAAGLIPIVGLIPLLGAGVAVFGSALRALELPRQITWAYVTAAVIAVGIGSQLVLHSGVRGASIALLLTSATTCAVMGWRLWKGLRQTAPAGPPVVAVELAAPAAE